MQNRPLSAIGRWSSATVYVVAEDAVLRWSLAEVLAVLRRPVLDFDTAGAFLSDLPEHPCGCLVLDAGPEGAEDILGALRRKGPDLACVVISDRYDAPTAVGVMCAGATNFLRKPPAGDQLVAASRDALLASEAASERSRRARDARQRISRLTRRRGEVLRLALASLTSTEIAERLGLSPRTVEHHRSAALDVLGVASLVEAAAMVLRAEVT